MQTCARLPSAPPLAAPGTSSRLSRAGDEHSTWSYLQRPGGLRQCTRPNLAINKLRCINQQLHLASLMQETGQRWVLFKQIYHGEEDIAFTNSNSQYVIISNRKPLRWCLPAPKRNVCRLHVPIKDLVPADHQQSILSSLSAKFHLDTSLFTAFQPEAFNNRKQKGGVRFPVRLLTRSFWPSIVKHQQEAICITIKALKIITEQFLLNSSYQSFWCRNSSDRHWPLKKLFSGQKPSPSNKGKAWDVPSRENMAGERNWTNSQII